MAALLPTAHFQAQRPGVDVRLGLRQSLNIFGAPAPPEPPLSPTAQCGAPHSMLGHGALSQGQLQALYQDPELGRVFDDMRKGGWEAALKHCQDETLMVHLSKKIGAAPPVRPVTPVAPTMNLLHAACDGRAPKKHASRYVSSSSISTNDTTDDTSDLDSSNGQSAGPADQNDEEFNLNMSDSGSRANAQSDLPPGLFDGILFATPRGSSANETGARRADLRHAKVDLPPGLFDDIPLAKPHESNANEALLRLRHDAELAHIFEDIKKNGQLALAKYLDDEDLMRKISRRAADGILGRKTGAGNGTNSLGM